MVGREKRSLTLPCQPRSIKSIISIETRDWRIKGQMAGKTISAYTDTETANRIAHIARIEQRKPSQIAGMALKILFAAIDLTR